MHTSLLLLTCVKACVHFSIYSETHVNCEDKGTPT